jgi:hypothetical protein
LTIGSQLLPRRTVLAASAWGALAATQILAQSAAPPAQGHPILLHAARLIEVDTGRILSPAEF